MNSESFEWERLQKALRVEAERGFKNIQGNRYSFHEFLVVTLNEPPANLVPEIKGQWHQLASRFSQYPQMLLEQRQHLLAETWQFVNQMQQLCVTPPPAPPMPAPRYAPTPSPQPAPSPTKTPKTPTTTAPTPSPTLPLSLEQPLPQVTGIGVKNAERLEKLGVKTVYDLLYYYPRDHLDYARQVKIRELQAGETVTLIAKVKRCTCFTSPRNKKLTILELILTDYTGQIKINRFYAGPRYANKGWQVRQQHVYPKGAIVAASGLVKGNKYGITLDNPELEVLDEEGGAIESMKVGRVVPVYPLTDGVGADLVRKAMITVLPASKFLKDPLPKGLLDKYQLIGMRNAIENIHFPPDRDCLAAARRRLVFDEFFYLQLGLLTRREQQRKTQVGAALTATGKLIEHFYQVLPFDLTNAQKRVIQEILQDLQKPQPMNRLVQGDVGAGKTVVAVVAMLAAIQAGFQAALMAPTEVLAEQHYRKLVSWFNLMHLPVELLTGSTKAAKRRQIHAQLETGELPVLVGTHALIQDTVTFNRLGLVVIDEQHRFGVHQRAKLQQKGFQGVPHVLTMTATPIPRTLALTLHGDLDVSQLDEMPPGRQPIQTTVLTSRQRQDAYDLILREVVQGRQIYVVLPLVEESEKLDVKSAVEEHHKLQTKVFPQFQVGLLHGRMNSADKDKAITQFREQETQILVSTTVVEVGVDVPNATVMLIENAERFGLSQLHQLRGRVGRGAHRSYCLLLSGNSAADARQRLQVLEQSQDGFWISEMDLRFRGPGQVLGTRQSGLPDFALASLVEDQEVLELAREAAQKVMEKEDAMDKWPGLKLELERRYQRLLGASILT